MGYWKLNLDCLYTLKNNWTDYYYDRLQALKDLASYAEETYSKEANDDLRYERYEARSVQKWYDEKILDLKKWIDSSMKSLEEDNDKFLELWNRACEDTYDSNYYGYMIIYDFYRYERRVELCPDIKGDTLRVRFSGQTHWYSICNRRKDLEFKTGKPQFDFCE